MKKMNGKKKPRRRRCGDCRILKTSTRRRVDPFVQDVHNKTVMRDLCDECEQERRWAI